MPIPDERVESKTPFKLKAVIFNNIYSYGYIISMVSQNMSRVFVNIIRYQVDMWSTILLRPHFTFHVSKMQQG